MSEKSHSEQLEKEPKVKIEQYSDEYNDQVKELIFDVYENEIGQHSRSGRPDVNNISEVYQNNGGNFWVAINDGKVVGTIGLRNQEEKRTSLHRFCVEKQFRGKGVSNKLFSIFMKFVDENDYQKVFLSTWEGAKSAINFYEKNGFKRIKSLPKDMVERPEFIHDKVFYELDFKK